MTTCKNCGHQIELNYCNNCGQKASVKRIEMKWLIEDLPHAIWHVDKGILYNLKHLCVRPGYAIAEYIEGKRKKIFHPVTYMLIGFALTFFSFHYLHFSYYYPYNTSDYPEWWNEFIVQYHHDSTLYQTNYLFLIIIGMPFSGLFIKYWLRLMGRRYNMAEGMVLIAFLFGQFQFIQGSVYIILAILKNNWITWIAEASIFIGVVMIIFPLTLYQLAVSKQSKILVWIWAFTGVAIEFMVWQAANQVIIWLSSI